MPRLKLTKSTIDALTAEATDVVYWDETLAGFGLKVTPKGKKVFIVLYRTKDGSARLRKYTIGPYGPTTPATARSAAQNILAARNEGRDPAGEKREARRRHVDDRIDEIASSYLIRHAAKIKSGKETKRLIEREVVKAWTGRSIHAVGKPDVLKLLDEIVDRGSPATANRTFTVIRSLFNWAIGRGIVETSPCAGLSKPAPERQRDRVLSDEELRSVLLAARKIEYPYGTIVEMLALTGQRREEVAGMSWQEISPDGGVWSIPASRSKNGRPHAVHLARQARVLLESLPKSSEQLFSTGKSAFNQFAKYKRLLDERSGVTNWVLHDLRRTVVSGMARLGVAPHVADKILNHQSGTISGVAAVYQRHEFMAERKEALELWASHMAGLIAWRDPTRQAA